MDEDTENSPGHPTAGPRRSAQREAELRACEPFIQGMLKNYAECGCPSGAQILILTDSVIWIVLEHPSIIKYIQVLSSIIHLAGFGSWMHWNSIEFHRIPSSGFLLVKGRSDTCIDYHRFAQLVLALENGV